jgi:hypothetical protein
MLISTGNTLSYFIQKEQNLCIVQLQIFKPIGDMKAKKR